MQAAVLGKDYVCPIHPDTPLPMMYMPDCLRATWQLISAPRESLTRCSYNVTAMSFTPAQLEASIRNCYPGFKVRAGVPAHMTHGCSSLDEVTELRSVTEEANLAVCD